MADLSSSLLVDVSISNSSEIYSAFKESTLKELKKIKIITKVIDLGRLLQKFFILFNFKIL
jgi:hypothetical protein